MQLHLFLFLKLKKKQSTSIWRFIRDSFRSLSDSTPPIFNDKNANENSSTIKFWVGKTLSHSSLCAVLPSLCLSTKLLHSIQRFPNWVLCQQLSAAARAAAASTSLSSLVAVILSSPENLSSRPTEKERQRAASIHNFFSEVSVLASMWCSLEIIYMTSAIFNKKCFKGSIFSIGGIFLTTDVTFTYKETKNHFLSQHSCGRCHYCLYMDK